MDKNILDCLERTEKTYSNKLAFVDNKREVTYKELLENSKKIGTYLSTNEKNQPIAIFIDKTVSCLETMFGVLYSGNFYTVIDTKSPMERINLILNTLEPIKIITDSKNLSKLKSFGIEDNICVYEDMLNEKIDEKMLNQVRRKMIDTDPMYILFTSGSTGVPKGTVIAHKSVISYSNWVKETFNITSDTIWGSQTPFYFSMSITDVFSTILSGATLYIIPKMYFSFPIKLLEFINEKKINTIYWVPSALCIVANFKALDEVELPTLKKVLFAGEVMPVKQLNMWIDKLPNTMFANLFGPTETTDICTYYIVDRKFNNNENLPIGHACNNCDVIVVKEDGTEAKNGEEGELCARGSFLALGYYNNPEKTASVFVQNPLNKNYSEIVYKTGDIVKYNERGELIYLSRKDFQIKYMGHRIELEEIDKAIGSFDGVLRVCSIFREEKSKLYAFYIGDMEPKELHEKLSKELPVFMIPSKFIKVEEMPLSKNGKIDRKKLEELI